MSILSDVEVCKLIKKGDVVIDPYFSEFHGPNLYYCHLGNKFLIPKKITKVNPLIYETKDIYDEVCTQEPIDLGPGKFILAETFEYLGIGVDYVVRLLNSSSLARVGISQAAVGMINSGCGMKNPIKLTLELVNNAPFCVTLVPTIINSKGKISWGTEILKIAVEKMNTTPSVSYDNWKSAVYHTDQKPSGPKMKGRFIIRKSILPIESIYRTKLKKTLSEST